MTNGQPGGQIKVEVIYSEPINNNGGGWIRLWQDQPKTQQIGLMHEGNGVYSGTLPNFPASTFYVEGILPSKVASDVTVQVRYNPLPGINVTDQDPVTVTPVVDEFSVNPKDPPTTTLLKDGNGAIYGISSGEQANGASARFYQTRGQIHCGPQREGNQRRSLVLAKCHGTAACQSCGHVDRREEV